MGFFKDLGKPAYNLHVKLILDSISFEDKSWPHFGEGTGGIADLVRFGEVCKFVNEHLSGNMHVTHKGYILDGYVKSEKLPEAKQLKNTIMGPTRAVLNLNENFDGLKSLQSDVRDKINTAPEVYLMFDDEMKMFVRAEGFLLYLPQVREHLPGY